MERRRHRLFRQCTATEDSIDAAKTKAAAAEEHRVESMWSVRFVQSTFMMKLNEHLW